MMSPTTKRWSLWTVVMGVTLVAVIAWQVQSQGHLLAMDRAVSGWMRLHVSDSVTVLMMTVTHWHDTLGILVMGLIVAAILARLRSWHQLWFLALALGGGMLLNVLLKLAFARARPIFDDPLVTLESYSFPSGHTAGSTLLYGTLGVLLAHQGHWRSRALWTGLVMVVLVSLSRVYLGAHYLSDVLAGVCVGLVWVNVCRLVLDRHSSQFSIEA